jgi:hypothetical protein
MRRQVQSEWILSCIRDDPILQTGSDTFSIIARPLSANIPSDTRL